MYNTLCGPPRSKLLYVSHTSVSTRHVHLFEQLVLPGGRSSLCFDLFSTCVCIFVFFSHKPLPTVRVVVTREVHYLVEFLSFWRKRLVSVAPVAYSKLSTWLAYAELQALASDDSESSSLPRTKGGCWVQKNWRG